MIINIPSNLPKEIDNIQTPEKSDFSISPSFIRCSFMNNNLYILYDNLCFSPNMSMFTNVKFDRILLKNKLEKFIKQEDKKYVKLDTFDVNRSRFCFDIESWLNDSFKGVIPTKILGYKRVFKLKKKVPLMLEAYTGRIVLKGYIDKYFKEYVKKHTELRKEIFGIITDNIEKVLKLNAVNMFDYNYDFLSNTITISLKAVYISTLVSWIAVESSKPKVNTTSDFDKNVYDFLKFKIY